MKRKIYNEIRMLISHYRLSAEDIRIDEISGRYEEANILDIIADELEELLDRPDIKAEEE